MTKKEELWHTKYKIWWYCAGSGIMILVIPLACFISPWFTLLLIPGVSAIVYAGKDDD